MALGENAFHMVFQERWVFSHSSPNPALAAAADLVVLRWGLGGIGRKCISHGFPGEMGFLPLVTKSCPRRYRGSGQDMVSSWEKTPSLLENHVKCISSTNVDIDSFTNQSIVIIFRLIFCLPQFKFGQT